MNLIPVNPIKERDYVQSDRKAIEAFKNLLEKNGINVTIRREMGGTSMVPAVSFEKVF